MKESVDKKEKKKKKKKEEDGVSGARKPAQEGLCDCRKFWRGPKFRYR